MKKKVLFVDDIEQNLISFKASFRKKFDVYTTSNLDEARALVVHEEIPVIVSDFKMPNENGVQFLESVKQRVPETIRILLTGHADLRGAINAVNRGEIYRFLEKPWSLEELEQSINNALEIFYARKMLKERNEELEKAYKELDNLVYSAAHDISSPLTSILNLVRLARDEPENSADYLDMIDRTAKKLTRYTREIIKYHKNKRTVTSYTKVGLKKIIEEIIRELAFAGKTGKVEIDLKVEEAAELYSDVSRIYTLMSNLISNAVKYQRDIPDGRVDINCHIDRSYCNIVVSDNGIGIPPEEQERVFDIYYRATTASEGTGIGLYIVKEVVDRLEGKISLESELGKGSSFKVKLPNRINQISASDS